MARLSAVPFASAGEKILRNPAGLFSDSPLIAQRISHSILHFTLYCGKNQNKPLFASKVFLGGAICQKPNETVIFLSLCYNRIMASIERARGSARIFGRGRKTSFHGFRHGPKGAKSRAAGAPEQEKGKSQCPHISTPQTRTTSPNRCCCPAIRFAQNS
jgi:hypothetical protein